MTDFEDDNRDELEEFEEEVEVPKPQVEGWYLQEDGNNDPAHLEKRRRAAITAGDVRTSIALAARILAHGAGFVPPVPQVEPEELSPQEAATRAAESLASGDVASAVAYKIRAAKARMNDE